MSAEAPLGHLSDPERVRASAFIHLPSRARFVGARAAVRGILSAYLGNAPHAVSITMDDRGKPRVLGGPCFNVSHSADRVVVAVSVTEVGVDIEAIEDRPGLPGIANRFLADGEVAALRHHSADAFAPAFYGCWTRKESLTKAVGLGLALPLRSFTVSVPPEPARLVSSSDDRLVADAWTLRDLAPGDGFAAALAASGSVDNLIEREWRWGSLEEQHA
jgi:4'-phosphopantetheinyl transferase